jgi:hypothetical protein
MVEKPLMNSQRENMLAASEALVKLADQEDAKDVEKQQRSKADMSKPSRLIRKSVSKMKADLLREDGPVWGKVRAKELLSLFIVQQLIGLYFTYSTYSVGSRILCFGSVSGSAKTKSGGGVGVEIILG